MYSLAYSPSYASGGVASLARQVQSKGRGDDTVLVHMTPGEVQGLEALARAHGGHLTRNPHTGLYEAGFLKSIFRPIEKAVSGVGDFLGDVAGGLKDIIKPVAKIAPFVLPFIPIPGIAGLSPLLTRALLSGALGGFSGRGGFDLKRGLTSGLMSYGIGSLMGPAAAEGASGAFGGDVDIQPGYSTPAPSVVPVPAPEATITPISYTPDASSYVGGAPATTQYASAPTGTMTDASPAVTSTAPTAEIIDKSIDRTLTGLPAEPSTLSSMGSLAGAVGDTALTQVFEKPVPTALIGAGIYSGIKTKQELEAQKAEAERILANREKEKQERIDYAQSVLRDYPVLYKQLTAEDVKRYGLAAGGAVYPVREDSLDSDDNFAVGGLTALAAGGKMPPRYLSGGGDGMSDSIPARIAGKQEARLADGEFVVPADVVSHIGNGSSNAGAKKLYAMMDRVRQARTGKKSQAPAVSTSRLMPA